MHITQKILGLVLLLTLPFLSIFAQDESIEQGVFVGQHTQIASTARITGKSSIGNNCYIDHYSILENCIIGNNVKIKSHSVLKDVTIADGAEIGPFAHLHDNSDIQEKAVIGNFVEITRSTVGKGSKAKHLTYLGDAELGEKVNIGGGTITCNYNGVYKNKTFIEDGALIGSSNCLVAPIIIGKGAMTGAGSVLTKNVPDNALAIERNVQVNKEEYASKLLQTYRQDKVAS